MTTKSWSTFSERARLIVSAAVQIERRDGAKAVDAIDKAGQRLGLTGRMARSILYSEPARMTRDGYEALLARWCSYQERQAEELEEKAAKLRRQVEQDRVRGKQLELDTAWQERSLINAACGLPGSRSGPGASRTSTV